MGEILGSPGILGQGGDLFHPILGCSRDGRDTWESRDTWTRGYLVHPIPGCSWDTMYLGIPGYLDKGGI